MNFIAPGPRMRSYAELDIGISIPFVRLSVCLQYCVNLAL